MIGLKRMSRCGFIVAFFVAAPSICPQLTAPEKTPPAPVKMKAIEPSVLYPAGRKHYTLNIIGEGFTVQDLPSYAIRIGEEQVRFMPIVSAQNQHCFEGLGGCLDFINPGMLQLRDFETRSGVTTFRLWTGTQWTDPTRITLSHVERQTLPWISFWALALTVVVLMAPVAIARGGMSIREFLLNKELEVYSVAKAQFLLWSVVLIFVYADRYLVAALIQRRFDIPEIPGGFAMLMGMSAFTAISSALIGRAKHSAGAAVGKPALSDFVRQFHVIQVERAQFATWTIAMAVVVVCRVVLPQDPVPEPAAVPPIFLWLTGISAASYLCGKLVRRPGPVLREATAKPDETLNNLRFVILGSNFSPVLRFEIDGNPVYSPQCKVSPLKSENKPAVSSDVEQTTAWITPAAATERSDGFVLEIASAQDAWLQGTHTLRIFNADNQSLDAQYTGLAFIYRPLTAKGPVRASQDWTPLVLTGLDVADHTPIQWHDASGVVSSLGGFRRVADKETPGSDSTKQAMQWHGPVSTIEISLRPGLTAGTGRLVFLPKDSKQFAVPVEVQ